MLNIKSRLRDWVAPDYDSLQEYVGQLQTYADLWPKFVDRQIVQHQLNNDFTTDGEEKEICVMFTDVRGFTKFAEKSSLLAANSFLNNFYDIVIEHTHNWGGVVDKFLGDGTMSIFGAFDKRDDYVQSCIGAARDILTDFGDMTSQKDEPSLFLGVGISAGPAILGTFGNGEMVSFTAIGHTVNLAARIQAKAMNNQILGTKSVVKHIPRDEYANMGSFDLKNVSKAIELYKID